MTTNPGPSENEEPRGFTVSDRRRLDPETGEVRQPPAGGLAGAEAEQGLDLDAELAAMADIDVKVQELTADLQRVHAEYANYRKRVDRDRELVTQLAVSGVLANLLPVLDDIDRAREHGELDGAFRSVGESLEAIVTRLGLERFGTADEPFDPEIHEALSSEARDGVTQPTVTSVYQPGYRFAGRVLRPARVAVAGTD